METLMGRFLKNKMWALMSKMVIKMEAVMNRIMMKMEASHETNEDIDQVADGIDNIDENTDIYSLLVLIFGSFKLLCVIFCFSFVSRDWSTY